jgi:hypothetical protein
MPPPTKDHIENLGPDVFPFERISFSRKLLSGESIVFHNEMFDATEDSRPENAVIVNEESREKNPQIGRYLWVIDRKGLKIILESTSNPNSERGCVCHTNITGGNKALQGGELWFGDNDTVYINPRSGRYGNPSVNQWIAVGEYFRYVGYSKVEQVI